MITTNIYCSHFICQWVCTKLSLGTAGFISQGSGNLRKKESRKAIHLGPLSSHQRNGECVKHNLFFLDIHLNQMNRPQVPLCQLSGEPTWSAWNGHLHSRECHSPHQLVFVLFNSKDIIFHQDKRLMTVLTSILSPFPISLFLLFQQFFFPLEKV